MKNMFFRLLAQRLPNVGERSFQDLPRRDEVGLTPAPQDLGRIAQCSR
jgi:hypothetical protein